MEPQALPCSDCTNWGGAYIGVGPEQNFTYIAAVRPDIAFIVNIRRQAVVQHLMFKASFELSRDRADFISLRFSKPRPAGVDSSTKIQALWDAYAIVYSEAQLASRSHARIVDHLTKTHGFTLTAEELGMLKWVWDAFTSYGPAITTNINQGMRGGASRGNFAMLTGYSTDATGESRSILSSEENYRYVRSMHERNPVIPVSGDFAGPRALRSIGAWLAQRNATISAYYLSNVEQYPFQDGKQSAFYANVLSLPTTSASVFIRPYSLRGRGFGAPSGDARPLCPIRQFLRASEDGRVVGCNDALTCVQ